MTAVSDLSDAVSAPTRIVFMGTPDFAVLPLQKLIDDSAYQVVGVVTQPDRPAGRGGTVQAPPVKMAALAAGIPIIQPEKLRAPGVFEQLQTWQPDLIIVAAFGQILRANVLDLPRFGCINVHASLLPRWRGAAPLQAAIRAGDAETGVTIMKMDVGLDTGAMLRSRAVSITTATTGESLHDILAALGADLLIDTLPDYLAGRIVPQVQNDALSTYAPMIKKEDGIIDWAQPATAIDRQIRAYTPWPGTATVWNGQPLKILGGIPLAGQVPIGQVAVIDTQIVVGTGDGVLQLTRVQLAGRGAVAISDFGRGHPAFIGAILGVQ